MQLQQNLLQLGLDEKEAKVYLAALELGPANIQNLTKKSGIKRSTVYEMIKNLKEMGLMSETTKGKRKLLIAADPENLKKNLVQKERLLAEILPELKSISNIGFIKPKIMFFEGREGLREIYWDTLKVKNKMEYWVSPIRDIAETVGEDFLIKYIDERVRKNIWIKSLHISNKRIPYKYLDPSTYQKTLRQVRISPPNIDIANTIAIYDNKVAVMSSKKEGFGFIIESVDYANTMKVFYDLLWNASREFGNEI
ncbi:MAG: helix-turn-helix domain-containing protein [bacterium]